MEPDNRSKKAICADELRRKVLTEELEPGAYLDETELSEAYGISRPPLREVLRQLEAADYALHALLGELEQVMATTVTSPLARKARAAGPAIPAQSSALAA